MRNANIFARFHSFFINLSWGEACERYRKLAEASQLKKGIRFANAIFRLPPPAPSHMGGGYSLSKFGVPPDGGNNLRGVMTCIRSPFDTDAKRIIFDVSLFIFFHTPCPLSLSEREGVPPHTRPFTFVNGTTTPLEGSGTWQGGHLHRYIKSVSGALPCYKEFAALILFLYSLPLPPPTWEGVMHS